MNKKSYTTIILLFFSIYLVAQIVPINPRTGRPIGQSSSGFGCSSEDDTQNKNSLNKKIQELNDLIEVLKNDLNNTKMLGLKEAKLNLIVSNLESIDAELEYIKTKEIELKETDQIQNNFKTFNWAIINLDQWNCLKATTPQITTPTEIANIQNQIREAIEQINEVNKSQLLTNEGDTPKRKKKKKARKRTYNPDKNSQYNYNPNDRGGVDNQNRYRTFDTDIATPSSLEGHNRENSRNPSENGHYF